MENLLEAFKKTDLTKVLVSLSIGFWIYFGLTYRVPLPEPIVVTKVETLETIKVVYEPSNPQRECLAQAIYAESRSEPTEGQLAVGSSVANRVADSRYPNTFCEVVEYRVGDTFHFSYQDKDDSNFYETARVFSNMRVTNSEVRAREKAYAVADRIMGGERNLPSDALNYHANSVTPPWATKLAMYQEIGAHNFYVGF